jgi:hypothetical protein
MFEPVPEPIDEANELWVATLLRDALTLKDASLVICRDKLIIEFKTEGLGRGLQRFVEKRFSTWQIGEFRDHHCHVSLEEVSGVEFSAEPAPCQGGKINYTVWFLTDWDSGNPFRKHGYFSITLNRPYKTDGSPRRQIIEPVFDLYREYQDWNNVSADDGFVRSMAEYDGQAV